MIIKRISPASKKEQEMDINVTQEQMDEYYDPHGRHIQHIFSNISAGEREFILTGITPSEWDELFGQEDDEQMMDEGDIEGLFFDQDCGDR